MTWKRLALVMMCWCWFAVGCGARDHVPAEPGPLIFSNVPAEVDPKSRYLIYLHGAIIEAEGTRPNHPEFGVYEYRQILEVFAAEGFVVISEARPSGTDGMLYASKVFDQVRALLAAGVSPGRVTVVGFSKGGGIAVAASSMLANDEINFVFMACCNPWLDDHPEIVARGRLLSLREATDDNVSTCTTLFDRSPSPHVHQEIVLEIGGGHGAFYRPLPEWIDPVVAWASVSE